jgi:hypothetical protein
VVWVNPERRKLRAGLFPTPPVIKQHRNDMRLIGIAIAVIYVCALGGIFFTLFNN